MIIEHSFLREHAVKNVWCSPEQDMQFVLKPQRVTSPSGAIRSYRLMWDLIPLPDSTSRWHILQVGGIDPIAFNLLAKTYEWVALSDACNQRLMHVNVYNINGVELPRYDTYYRYTASGTLIFALKINRRIPALFSTDTFSIRVYSNAYWNSIRSAGIARTIEVFGETVESAAVRSAFIAQYQARLAENPAPGVLSFYHNGLKCDHLIESEILVGDSVEYVWDASIKNRVRIPITSLPTFQSTLDNVSKMLVHFAGNSSTIDYHDDVDFYIEGTGANPISLYYHRGIESAVRQVTHRDYSLITSYVQRYCAEIVRINNGGLIANMHLVMTVRHSGFSRPLVYENNHINELYKLADQDIVDAMVGLDANVSVWRAAALENSGYTRLMAAHLSEITPALTESAYGYYAMAKYLADTPSTVQNALTNAGYVEVPFKLQSGATAYEYNEDGLLLEWNHHYLGDRYYVNNPLARRVELIAGFGGEALDEIHGVTTAPILDDRNYKVYQRTRVGGIIQNDPRDISDSASFTIANGVFTWTSNSITAFPTLRSDKKFYAADHTVNVEEGQLRINLQTLQTINGNTGWGALAIPLGQLDVFLNGRGLIRGLEYFYSKGSIYITAKEYLVMPVTTAQQVHVRMTGFCRKDMSIYPEGDVGYIEHGLLSNNRHFDIRDGKVQRLLVRGKLLTKADVIFSEDSDQISVSNAANGSPYLVKDLHVPLRPEVAPDTYALIEAAQTVDQEISDYLTLHKPQPNRGPVASITSKYQVFSPFLCKLIFDMKFQRLVIPSQNSFTRLEVITVCKAYEHLLEVDPISYPDIVNPAYVVILPHSLPNVISLTARQYQFMTRVVEHYTSGLVSLSASLSISG